LSISEEKAEVSTGTGKGKKSEDITGKNARERSGLGQMRVEGGSGDRKIS